MAAERQWMRKLTDRAELYGEALPGVPLVEIAGENRVLMECHCGVREYGKERITVGVCYGNIQITGKNLELTVMSRKCLVISGQIEHVELCRKGKGSC